MANVAISWIVQTLGLFDGQAIDVLYTLRQYLEGGDEILHGADSGEDSQPVSDPVDGTDDGSDFSIVTQ